MGPLWVSTSRCGPVPFIPILETLSIILYILGEIENDL